MCGVIGLYSTAGDDVFANAVSGLFQMQHRGQDACGLAITDGRHIRLHKGLGYVREVFHKRPSDAFAGRIACGHVRYPTQGGNRLTNAQPHVVSTLEGSIMSLSSNGDLTNYWEVRKKLEAEGVDFVGTNDAELILKKIAFEHLRRGNTIIGAIRQMQREIRGAYSTVLITRDRMYAIRDPLSIRPLVFGQVDGTHIVASESNALDINLADMTDQVGPGEIIEFGPDGPTRLPMEDGSRRSEANCVFEFVYFSRPDSITFGQRVYDVRKEFGAWLAKNDDVNGDVVVPVPDSANAVALGYALESGLPFEFGLIRNHYVGRTFIRPDQSNRDGGVKMKFNPLRSVFKNRKVILVDDSIVRGTTLRKIVRMVRGAGASEVHLRIGSPVTKYSCYYGVDTPNAEELIGNTATVDEICTHLTADSLRYMSLDGIRECVGDNKGLCMACFDGEYPVPLTETKNAQ